MELTPEVQERLLEYLTSLESAVKTGSDFVQEQAPLVVQELIAFKRFEYTLGLVAGVLAFASLSLIPRYVRWVQSGRGKWKLVEDFDFLIFMGSFAWVVIGTVSGFAFTCANLFPCIKAWVAPRLTVLEELGKIL